MSSSTNTDRRPQWADAQPVSGIEIVVSAVQGTAFWTTVLLPVLVPLLVVVGIVTMTPYAAVGFLGAYCACAVLGHNHSPT